MHLGVHPGISSGIFLSEIVWKLPSSSFLVKHPVEVSREIPTTIFRTPEMPSWPPVGILLNFFRIFFVQLFQEFLLEFHKDFF